MFLLQVIEEGGQIRGVGPQELIVVHLAVLRIGEDELVSWR